ncbi:hypothetical protein K8R04_01460 [Candidatus Uhrbacteria bacterium]|nr:hypothetical protein [Candidatus Uhrbacteria bacterium]
MTVKKAFGSEIPYNFNTLPSRSTRLSRGKILVKIGVPSGEVVAIDPEETCGTTGGRDGVVGRGVTATGLGQISVLLAVAPGIFRISVSVTTIYTGRSTVLVTTSTMMPPLPPPPPPPLEHAAASHAEPFQLVPPPQKEEPAGQELIDPVATKAKTTRSIKFPDVSRL